MENFKKVEGEDLEKVSGGVRYDELIGPGGMAPPVIGLRDYIKKCEKCGKKYLMFPKDLKKDGKMYCPMCRKVEEQTEKSDHAIVEHRIGKNV